MVDVVNMDIFQALPLCRKGVTISEYTSGYYKEPEFLQDIIYNLDGREFISVQRNVRIDIGYRIHYYDTFTYRVHDIQQLIAIMGEP